MRTLAGWVGGGECGATPFFLCAFFPCCHGDASHNHPPTTPSSQSSPWHSARFGKHATVPTLIPSMQSLAHEATYMVAAVDEVVAQVASHKAGTARNKHAILLHARLGLDRRALILRALRLLHAKINSTQGFGRRTGPGICCIPPSAVQTPASAWPNWGVAWPPEPPRVAPIGCSPWAFRPLA